MDVVTRTGALFPDRRDCQSRQIMFDVTVTNPLGRTRLERSGLRSGHAIGEAIKGKHRKYRGTYHATYKFLPLAFSTCGDYGRDVHELLKELGRFKAMENMEFYLSGGAGQQALIGRETGRLRRRLSVTLQTALSYRTLRYRALQRIYERGRHIHRPTEPRASEGTMEVGGGRIPPGVTEPQIAVAGEVNDARVTAPGITVAGEESTIDTHCERVDAQTNDGGDSTREALDGGNGGSSVCSVGCGSQQRGRV